MPGTWRERFNAFMAEFLKEEHNIDADEILSVEQEEAYGGCETCGYGETGPSITVSYRKDGQYRFVEFPGNFGTMFNR